MYYLPPFIMAESWKLTGMFKSVTVTKPLPISVFDGTAYVVVEILVSPAPT
jgi:hypothetical protein